MNKRYDTFIFDVDGTLVHTMPKYKQWLIREILKIFNKKTSDQLIEKFWFETNRSEIVEKEFGISENVFWKIYNGINCFEKSKHYVKIYDDVIFLNELKKQGYKTGLVTGAPPYIAKHEIGLLNPKENIDAIIIAHANNYVKPKPDPEGLVMCINSLDSKKENTLYIGNSKEDIDTAKNAGVSDVLIDREEYKFKGLKPSLIIKSLYELRQFI